jgi:glutamine synthetase
VCGSIHPSDFEAFTFSSVPTSKQLNLELRMATVPPLSKDLKLIRFTWCGSAGITKAKTIHHSNWDSLEKITKEGIGLCTAVEALPVMYDAIAPNAGVGPVGEVRLKPDWSTFRSIPYANGQARVLVDMYELDGEPSQHCPRSFLRRMVAEAAKEGFIIKAGFENEFILLKKTNDDSVVGIDDTVYCSTLSIDINSDFVIELLDALTDQGIKVELYHPESATGQQEIAVVYSDVMTAADQQIILKETVKAIAIKHDCLATFVPCVFPEQAGNGAHIHFSIHTLDGTNIVPNPTKPNEISETASYFIAGMLEHMEGLMALSCPTTNSYRRIIPGHWSGAYRVWGYGNREASIRVPANATSPSPTHFELKTSDPAGNPYFVLAASIAAGLDGIRRKIPIPPPCNIDPFLLTDEERKEKGIERFPTSLRQTIDALSKDKVLLDALQPRLAKAIIAIREMEYETMKDMSFELERKLLLQRF